MTAPTTAPDPEKADIEKLKELQSAAKKLAGPLLEIASINLKDPQAVAEIEKILGRLIEPAALASSVATLRSDATTVVRSVLDSRKKKFGRVLSEFIQGQRTAGVDVREVGEGSWRVGKLEVEGDASASRARAKYAKNDVLGWRAVASSADLAKLVEEALAALAACEISEPELGPIFQEAYTFLLAASQSGSTAVRRVRLVDLRREVHLAVLRQVLKKPDGDKKVSKIVFPSWAFAYNADRYRRIQRDLPPTQRLSFETGSQQDHKNGINVTMNGLDAKLDHKSYCYAELAPSEAKA